VAGDTRTLTIKWVGDTSSVEKSAKKAGGALGKVGTIAAGAFTGTALLQGAEQLGHFLEGSTQKAIEDSKAQTTLAKTMKNTVGARQDQIDATEDFIAKTQKATGVLDDDLRPAFSTLLRGSRSVGQAQKDLNLALDIQAGTGKPLASITQALAKGYLGSTGALGKLGIKTSQLEVVQGKQKKTALTMTQIMKEANKTFGGQAAAAADTSAGKMKRLSTQWEDMQEQIGFKLLPALTLVADFLLNTLPQAVGVVVTWFQVNWPKISAAIAPVVTIIRAHILAMVAVIKGVILVLQGVIQFVRGVFTGQWGQAWGGIKKIFEGIVIAILGILRGMWTQFVTIITTGGKLALAAFVAVMSWIGNTIQTMIGRAVSDIAGLGARIASALWGGIQTALGAAVSFGARIGSAIYNAVKGAVSGLANVLAGVIRSAINAVLSVWNSIDFGIHIKSYGIGKLRTPGLDINDLIPDVPLLASGGITRGSGLAFLHPLEAVVPLGRNGPGGNNYTINVAVGPATAPAAVGAAVVGAIRAYEARNGASWRGGKP